MCPFLEVFCMKYEFNSIFKYNENPALLRVYWKVQLKTTKRQNCKVIAVFTHDSIAAQAQFCCPKHRRSTLQEVSFVSQPDFQSFSRPHKSIFVFCFLDHCQSCFLFCLAFCIFLPLSVIFQLLLFADIQSHKSVTPLSAPLQTNRAYFPWHISVPVCPSTSESRLSYFTIFKQRDFNCFLM